GGGGEAGGRIREGLRGERLRKPGAGREDPTRPADRRARRDGSGARASEPGRADVGTPGPRPVVLDAGALIEFDRGAERMRALVRLARQRAVPLIVPAGALAQAWRDGRRQARLAALVGAPDTRIDVLDEAGA